MIVLNNVGDGTANYFFFEGGFVQIAAQGSTGPGLNTSVDVLWSPVEFPLAFGNSFAHIDLTAASPDAVQVHLPPGYLTCRASAGTGVSDIVCVITPIPG